MYKDNILKFASEQTVEVIIIEGQEQKTIRRQGDLSKWFGENDTIEFDDSTEAFSKTNLSDKLLEVVKVLDIKVYKDGSKLNLNKEPFKMTKEIVSCVVSFFVYGS